MWKISKEEVFIIKIAFMKIIIFSIILIIFDKLFEDFDQSTSLLVSEKESKELIFQLIKPFARWDSLFYIEIYSYGYQYELTHAFFPLFPIIAKFLNTNFVSLFIKCNLISFFLTAYILNALFLIIGSVILYRLSLIILCDKRLSGISTFLFIFNPASVFYSALYSEPLFVVLTLSSFYFLFQIDFDIIRYNRLLFFKKIIFPFIFLFFSVFVRSIGMFYVVVFGYFILRNFVTIMIKMINENKLDLIKFITFYIFIGIFMIFIIIIPYLLILYYAYTIYCLESYVFINPIWCSESLPNIYNYVQKQYWNVGFLSEYRLERTVFIYWGIQTLIFIGFFIFDFLKENWLSFITLGHKQKITEKKNKYYNDKWNPIMIYVFILFVISVFFAHIQSCTRFFSTCPAIYWFYTIKLVDKENKGIKIFDNFLNKWIIFYFIQFNVFGLIFYSNFLPWT